VPNRFSALPKQRICCHSFSPSRSLSSRLCGNINSGSVACSDL